MITFVFVFTLLLCLGMAMLSLHSRILNQNLFLRTSHLMLVVGLSYMLWNIHEHHVIALTLLWIDVCMFLGLLGYAQRIFNSRRTA